MAEKPSFREAYKKRRCLIPASGFYEWEKTADGKQPHYFYLKDRDIFAFGGLWEKWIEKETGEQIESCTIITTEANELLKSIRERMPVIIEPKDYNQWLTADQMEVRDLLKPFQAEQMKTRLVSKDVIRPKIIVPELLNKV